MTIDKNILESVEEKINETGESKDISKILIKWLKAIDNGEKDLDTNRTIQELIDKIK